MTAEEALEENVKVRLRMLEGETDLDCPLCEYNEFHGDCPNCPMIILTGVDCYDHDKYYHRLDPEMGVSFALALQYYWDERQKESK